MSKENESKLLEEEDGKIILIVKAYPNYDLNKWEFDWDFPNTVPISGMLGVLDLVKSDLIDDWKDQSGAYDENVEEI